MLDTNNDGINDLKQPWLWLKLGGFVSALVKMFAPSHTIAFKVATQYDEAVKKLGQ